MLVATIVYWVGVSILSLIAFSVMGTSGFFTPYQIDDPYSIYICDVWRILPFDVGEWLCCGSVLHGHYVMLVTAKMHTPKCGGLHSIYITLYDAVYGKSFVILFGFLSI